VIGKANPKNIERKNAGCSAPPRAAGLRLLSAKARDPEAAARAMQTHMANVHRSAVDSMELAR